MNAIKLKHGMAGGGNAWAPGAILRVGEDMDEGSCERLVAAGYAEEVKDEPVVAPVEVPPPIIETQTITAPEAAVLPKGKGKRK